MLAVGAAEAQTVDGLRGLPDEEELVGIGRSDPDDQASALDPIPYRPSSAGATPEPQTEESVAPSSIFEDSRDANEIEFLEDGPSSTYRPSTARQRSRSAQARASGSPTRGTDAATAATASPSLVLPETGTDAIPETSGLRATRDTSEDAELTGRVEAENVRLEAIEGRGLEPAENPYAPLGMRAGRFILTPTLEQGLTATDNVNFAPEKRSAVLSETTLRLNAVSDWSRHFASLDLYGTARESISGENFSELELGADGVLDLDLANGYRLRAEGGYRQRPEDATSPVVIAGIDDEPIRHELTGSLGLSKDVGKLRLGLTGSVEREIYGDAKIAGGGTLSQAERDSTLASMVLRAGYAISPALTPFVEAELGRRFYDQEVDSAGYERSADRYGVRAGLAFDLTEKLYGEVSAGYLREAIDDPRLRPVEGPTLAAALNWSPIRGTLVRLSGDTLVEGTTSAGDSGSILHSGRLSVERELRANLTGTALLGLSWRDYAGVSDTETILSGELGMTWWLSRYAGLTGRVRHERFTSTLPDRDSETSSVFVGMTLRR